MCLLFCFVLFWILCCVVCEKIKIVDNKKKNYSCGFSAENVMRTDTHPLKMTLRQTG